MKTRIALAILVGVVVSSPLYAAQTSEPGVWVRHRLEFNYMPLTTIYSCVGLEHKLRVLLHVSGARDDMKVMTFGCARGTAVPDRFARARLDFWTLKPAPAAASGGPAAGATNGIWKKVELALRPRMDLGRGDCELIEQFQHNILSTAFAVRDVQGTTSCQPFQLPTAGYALSFEVFVPEKG